MKLKEIAERIEVLAKIRYGNTNKMVEASNGVLSSSVLYNMKRVKPSAPNIIVFHEIATLLDASMDYLYAGKENDIINDTVNKKENEEMEKELRFFENPLPLILKALRRERFMDINRFARHLDEHYKKSERASRHDFNVTAEAYALYENADYDYDDIEMRWDPDTRNDVHFSNKILNAYPELNVSISRAIHSYYCNKLDMDSVFFKKEYSPNDEYYTTDFMLGVKAAMRIFGIDTQTLADDIGVEKISILSWLSGERDIHDNELCKGRICKVLCLDEDGDFKEDEEIVYRQKAKNAQH